MMPRYRKVPKSYGWVEDEDAGDYGSFAPDLTVCDHEATFTGLLDKNGDEIWREPNGCGFMAEID